MRPSLIGDEPHASFIAHDGPTCISYARQVTVCVSRLSIPLTYALHNQSTTGRPPRKLIIVAHSGVRPLLPFWVIFEISNVKERRVGAVVCGAMVWGSRLMPDNEDLTNDI
jgi:hypothetical protein